MRSNQRILRILSILVGRTLYAQSRFEIKLRALWDVVIIWVMVMEVSYWMFLVAAVKTARETVTVDGLIHQPKILLASLGVAYISIYFANKHVEKFCKKDKNPNRGEKIIKDN